MRLSPDPAWRRWLPLLLAFPLLLACNLSLNLDFDGETVVETNGADWYQIYFTDPTCPPESQRVGGVDHIIAQDLLQAQSSVDVAAYDLDALPIVDALIALEQRGVLVRVVTDTDNEDLSSIRRLRRNGISVVTDDRSALMHDKFIVIDRRYVWTGSLNYTSNGAYCNNNNAVRFDVPPLADNYVAEMDEMYDDGSFGPRSPARTPHENIRVGDVRIENYFAPEEEIAPIVARLVDSAQEEVLFMAFSFTEESIGQAMLERARGGVRVRGVFETVGSETSFSNYPVFGEAGLRNLQVRQDGNRRLMHHKVIIVDQETVVFGSYNFTNSANDDNDENLVFVYDPRFTGFFLEEFTWVWDEAR